MSNRLKKLILLTFLSAVLFAGAPRISYAQQESNGDNPAPPASAAENIEEPDYSQFLPQTAPTKNKVSFYERCLLSADSITDSANQKSMCACLSANESRLAKSDIKMEYWANGLGKRPVTPYEIFVTRIFAPCMYLEAATIGQDQCYRDNRFLSMFRIQQNYDAYCECYSDAAVSYMQNYAQPLLAAKMAGASAGQVFPSVINMKSITGPPDKYDDPVTMVTEDPDYQIYMDSRQRECLRTYSINPSAFP